MAELEDYTIEVLEKEGKTIIPVTTTQAVMTSSGRYLEESIVEMEDVSEGEIVDISPEVEINPSIPSGAEVISCSSMRVGEKYYSMSSVEANPEIPEGTTPTALENLQIGNGYYSAGGGGGVELYRHVLIMYKSSHVMYGVLYNNSTEPFTTTSLKTYLSKNVNNKIILGGIYYYSSSYFPPQYLTYQDKSLRIYLSNGSYVDSASLADIVFDMEGNLV